jgi:hypothetical protein
MGQVPDPRDLEERIGWIKASISARVSELGRRVERVRSLSDLTEAVGQNPWTSVGVAFAAGVLMSALGRSSRRDGRPESLIGSGVRAILVSVAASYGKKVAQQWIDQHLHERELHAAPMRAPAHTVARTPSREPH